MKKYGTANANRINAIGIRDEICVLSIIQADLLLNGIGTKKYKSNSGLKDALRVFFKRTLDYVQKD